MRLLFTAIIAVAAAAAASSAAADPAPPADIGKMVTDDCARAAAAKKQCVLQFDAHDIGGGRPGGDGHRIEVLTPTKSGSLIRVRKDFIPEILKTAEDL
jgi:hypothetical protein